MKKVNPFIQWWVTPKLPPEDIFADNTKGKKGFEAFKINFSQWVIHPIKRRFVRSYLRFLKKYTSITVIGVTGSAGKSTTVQMLASILKTDGKTHATIPSIDPVYNIPNTIANCPIGTRYLILEMSVEYPNEMDYYLWLAKPDVGVILNIYPTHTQFFGSERGVFIEKAKLLEAINSEGIAVLNADDKSLKGLRGKLKAKTVWFSTKEYEIKSSNEFTLNLEKDKISVQLPILGNQFIQNAVAAAVCAFKLGITPSQIKTGLESFTPPEHRMGLIKHKSGALILDDTYNSNPQAAREALKTFIDFARDRKKIIVMGDMLELGEHEVRYHQELGELIGKEKVDYLMGVGEASKQMIATAAKSLGKNKTVWVSDQKKVFSKLSPFLEKNSVILLKGSRSIHLENVVEALSKE